MSYNCDSNSQSPKKPLYYGCHYVLEKPNPKSHMLIIRVIHHARREGVYWEKTNHTIYICAPSLTVLT